MPFPSDFERGGGGGGGVLRFLHNPPNFQISLIIEDLVTDLIRTIRSEFLSVEAGQFP